MFVYIFSKCCQATEPVQALHAFTVEGTARSPLVDDIKLGRWEQQQKNYKGVFRTIIFYENKVKECSCDDENEVLVEKKQLSVLWEKALKYHDYSCTFKREVS